MRSFAMTPEDADRILAPAGQIPAMNDMEGFAAVGLTSPSVAELLPPQLRLINPKQPSFYLYITQIRQPTFCSWYYEVGLGLFAQYGDVQGVYYLSLMLSGPGAEMATYIGRENSGIPKKLAQEIHIERDGGSARCWVQRDGVRLCDAELTLGRYDLPLLHQPQEGCSPQAPIQVPGSSLYYKYQLDEVFHDLRLIHYPGFFRYYQWEPAQVRLTLASSDNDPWGQVPIVQPLMAGWMTADSVFGHPETLCTLEPEAARQTMPYLLAGRFDCLEP